MKKYKVTIDRNKCISCGSAPALCPEIYYLDPSDWKNRVKSKYEVSFDGNTSVGIVPEELYQCAKTGAEACPVQAITVEETQ